jgi:hypothetical protein
VLLWLVAPQILQRAQPTPSDEDIVFTIKVFSGTKAYVAAKGTLTADWMAYKNNIHGGCTSAPAENGCIQGQANMEMVGILWSPQTT